MTTESNMQKAVELLRECRPSYNNGHYATLLNQAEQAIALLSPPPLSRDEQLAKICVSMANNEISLYVGLNSIAKILREPK